MVFNSLWFAPFLAVVLTGYHVTKSWVLKRLWLVLASYAFYGLFDATYVLLLGFATTFTWFTVEWGAQYPRARKLAAITGVAVPLGLLFHYKYSVFLVESAAHALGRSFRIETILLPVGISFYLFHCISYVVDAFKGGKRASLLDYALYVAFFPQLVAGPIVRAADFLPQLQRASSGIPEWKEIHWGIVLFVLGVFQKVVLADGVFAGPATIVFESARSAASSDAWVGALAFSGQIYFDFAGYSTCAIGVSRLFGFRLPINFHYPYAASSFSDFWRRWHVSLSSWLRDYLYVPLGGNRGGSFLTHRNLLVTMLLGGLWHGADWTFVVWGGLHGLYLVVERIVRLPGSSTAPVPLFIGWLVTFLLTVVAWVFFRAANLGDALSILRAMAVVEDLTITRLGEPQARLVVAAIAGTLVYSRAMRNRTFADLWQKLPSGVQGLALGLAITLTAVWREEPREFIYFAF